MTPTTKCTVPPALVQYGHLVDFFRISTFFLMAERIRLWPLLHMTLLHLLAC
jgi:hypothetical protein